MTRPRKPGVTLNSNGAYWQARIVAPNGRAVVRSVGSKKNLTRAQARAKAQEFADDVDAHHGKKLTLRGWCITYEQQRSALSEATQRVVAQAAMRLIKFFGAGRTIDTIDRADAAEWRAAQTRLSEATICKLTRHASAIFRLAHDQDLVRFNPFDRLPSRPPVIQREEQPVTSQKVATLLEACPSSSWRALLGLCAYAGLRRGEALRICWRHVGWSGHRLMVYPEGGRVTTKQRYRTVRLAPALEALLLQHHDLLECEDDRIYQGPRNNLHRGIAHIFATAGVPLWSKPFHSLRAWRATTWKQTYPEYVVDAWLGHSREVSRMHYLTIPEDLYRKGHTDEGEMSTAKALTGGGGGGSVPA